MAGQRDGEESALSGEGNEEEGRAKPPNVKWGAEEEFDREDVAERYLAKLSKSSQRPKGSSQIGSSGSSGSRRFSR
jgi:hypothetical protein